MRRRHCFLLTIVFLAGLIALDWELARRPGKIQTVIRREIDSLFKDPPTNYAIDIVSPTEVRIDRIDIRAGRHSDDEFLTCETLIARIDFWKLLRGELELDQITLLEPELHLRWATDGELSLPSIFAPTESEGDIAAPEILVQDMKVLFHDAPFWGKPVVVVSGIDLDMQPSLSSKSYPYFLKGRIRDPSFGDFDLEAHFGGAQLRGLISQRDFKLGPKHTAHLRKGIRETIDRVKMTEGTFDLSVEFFADDVLDHIDYEIVAEIKDVQLSYESWPFAISGMQGRLRMADLKLTADLLEFQLSDALVTVNEMTVDFDGAEPGFSLAASVRGLHLEEKVAADLMRLPEPFPDVGESLEALGIRGRIDLDLDLKKEVVKENTRRPGDSESRVIVDILAKFREAELTYRGFADESGVREGYPYPLESIVGTVRIQNDGLEFRDLRSTVRSPDLIANGWVTYGRADFGFSVDIRGYGIHLDEKVRMTLPVGEREVYDSYEPSGPVDFVLRIDNPQGREGPPDVLLDVELQGCAALPRLFPYPLEDLRGHLVFGKTGGTLIQDLTASNKQARFNIEGVLDHSSAVNDPSYTLDIRVEDLAVDDHLLIGLSAEFPDIASEIRRYNFAGLIDFDCQISSEQEGALNRFAAELKGLDFRYEEFPNAHCRDLRGHIVAQGDRLQIDRASFDLADCKVAASGWVDIKEGGAHDLFLDCPELRVNEETLRIAEDAAPFIGDLAELMDIQGGVTLSLKMRKGSRGELVRTSVTAQGLRIELKEPSLVFEDVHGSLTVDRSGVHFEGWTAALPYGDGIEDRDRLIVNVNSARWDRGSNGHAGLVGGEDDHRIILHEVGFRDLMLDERLFRRLPEDWARTLRDWKLDGRLAGRLKGLTYRAGEAGFHGELIPGELSLDPGVPIGLNHGRILIEDGVIGADRFDIKGSLEDADLSVLDFPMVHAKAVFQVDHRSVAVRELAADCLGGRVNPKETFFVMDHGIDGHFEASASMSEIDLSEWVGTRGGDPKQVSGRATAWARMDGLMGKDATYRGQGEMWLSGRRLYDLPLLATILRFLNLDFLGNDGVQTAHFESEIKDERVLVKNARFDGPGVRLRGGGHIGFDGIAQLEFSPKIIKLLDPIPLIGDIVNIATGFVVSKIKITGPLEDLRAEGENYITEMLPGEEDSGRRLKPRPVEPERE